MEGDRYGGFSDAALYLTLTYRKLFSRQVIYRWYTKRDTNGFPDMCQVDGSRKLDLAEVAEWYAAYVPSKGGRPPQPRQT